MSTEENPRVQVETRGGRTVRTTVWHHGTWNERTTAELKQRCRQCSSSWWTEEDPRKPVEVTCDACRNRQAEQSRGAEDEEARRLRFRRRVVLIPVVFFVASCLIAIIGGIIAGLVNGK